MIRALLLADTHLGDGEGGRLLARIGNVIDSADVILHAGDVTDISVLHVLAEHAPVHAVLGNNDGGLDLPERRVLAIDGCSVGMVHDSGQSAGRADRLRRWFPDADVVVFGHSHIPWNESHARDGHVQHHVNPGSAIQRRGQPRCTIAWLELDDGSVRSIRHEPVLGG